MEYRSATAGTVPDLSTLTLGVEEEFLLLDPASGREPAGRRPGADRAARRRPGAEPAGVPAQHGGDGHPGLRRPRPSCARTWWRCAAPPPRRPRRPGRGWWRSAPPRCAEPHRTVPDEPRYHAMSRRYGPVAHDPAVCGCHVHVGRARPGTGRAGLQPPAAVAAGGAGDHRQLAAARRARHRPRQLALDAAGTLAQHRPHAVLRLRRRLRRDRRRADRRRASCSTPRWSTGTPGRRRRTRRWRSGSATSAPTWTTRCWSPRWSGHWSPPWPTTYAPGVPAPPHARLPGRRRPLAGRPRRPRRRADRPARRRHPPGLGRSSTS